MWLGSVLLFEPIWCRLLGSSFFGLLLLHLCCCRWRLSLSSNLGVDSRIIFIKFDSQDLLRLGFPWHRHSRPDLVLPPAPSRTRAASIRSHLLSRRRRRPLTRVAESVPDCLGSSCPNASSAPCEPASTGSAPDCLVLVGPPLLRLGSPTMPRAVSSRPGPGSSWRVAAAAARGPSASSSGGSPSRRAASSRLRDDHAAPPACSSCAPAPPAPRDANAGE